MMTFPSIRIEGGLFSPDLLEALTNAELPGQKPQDFRLPSRRSLTDEIAAAFSDARTYWSTFKNRLERVPENDLATTPTRDTWMIPFFSLLGFELCYNPRAYQIDGLTFAISHRAGEREDAPPVHIVGVRQELGRLPPSGRPRLSPHALVQEYLNRSEALWGIVTNGKTLRLLRDSTFVRRQAYLEFDLEAILEEERFVDFVVLYRLLHRTRFPSGDGTAAECLLEKYYQRSIEQGGRVREHLREGVEECLKILANGFLQHEHNNELRQWLQTQGATSSTFYRELLQLAYRFLFLLVSEERGLISRDQLYLEHYSVSRLRRLADQRAAYTEDDDLWQSLRALWLILANEHWASLLGAAPLNGELFSPLHLDSATITNCNLLRAFWYLAYYHEKPSAPPRRVNYAALDTEELGSVYESLLDLHPQLDLSGATPRFDFVAGTERKSTGSYYTPPELVGELVRSALEPVLQERLQQAKTPHEREQAVLSIRVCDPACGSGHFLLAAARRLGKELARIRTQEDEPAPERVREAIRDVVAHCLYGVDKNSLAVELCRMALWLEAHTEGKPLTFLDHRIRCGDSLLGVLDLNVLSFGIPDEAFTPLSGDDKELAKSLKGQNRAERAGQRTLFDWNLQPDLTSITSDYRQVDAIPDDSPRNVHRKREAYERGRRAPHWCRQQEACHLWMAAFFQPLTRDSLPITTEALRNHLANRPAPQVLALAKALAQDQGFFHWPLEFPDVFAQGGFDVVLSNPPWERIKLQEQEFFATRDKEIANALNAAARKRLIERLPTTNPVLWDAYRAALHAAEADSKFLRSSGAYRLTGRGDINTYSVFAERITHLLKPTGRAGVIVPTGIATDDTNKDFFAQIVKEGKLVSLFDLENREALFPGVHRSYKFSLLTMRALPQRQEGDPSTFAFFCTRAAHIQDKRCCFTLTPEEIGLLNPNTPLRPSSAARPTPS